MAQHELNLKISNGKIKYELYNYATHDISICYDEEAIRKFALVQKKFDQIKKVRLDNGNILFELEGEKIEVAILDYKKFINIPGFAEFYKKLGVIKAPKPIPKNTKLQKSNKFASKIMIVTLAAAILLGVGSYAYDKKDSTIIPGETSSITETVAVEIPSIGIEEQIVYVPDVVSSPTTTEAPTILVNENEQINTEKAVIAKEKYESIISKYSDMYGVDKDIMLAIATQERGVHSSQRDDSGAIGLMQIEVGVWDGAELTIRNMQDNTDETLHITEEKLRDVEYNIRVGCAIYQDYCKSMFGNKLAAIQCYNMGYGNMMKVLRTYAQQTGRTVEEVLTDKNDIGWVEYRNIIDAGDKSYIEHVTRYIDSEKLCETLNVSKETLTEISGFKIMT